MSLHQACIKDQYADDAPKREEGSSWGMLFHNHNSQEGHEKRSDRHLFEMFTLV